MTLTFNQIADSRNDVDIFSIRGVVDERFHQLENTVDMHRYSFFAVLVIKKIMVHSDDVEWRLSCYKNVFWSCGSGLLDHLPHNIPILVITGYIIHT